MKRKPVSPDFLIENHGSIYLLRPTNDSAREFLAESVDPDNSQWFGGALVVEHRYIGPLVDNLREDGFVL